METGYTLYVPMAHPMTLLHDSVTDYRLTWFSCLAMVVSRALEFKRWRKIASGRTRATRMWQLTFYWPVYVWGLQAMSALIFGALSGCWSGGPGAARQMQMLCWGAVYASTLSCVYVVTICTAARKVVNQKYGVQAGYAVGIPIPICVAVVNVMFANSYLVFVLATAE